MRFYVFLILVAAALAAQRVRIEDLGRVHLRQGALTAEHRGAPVPQMDCVGGSARSQAGRVGGAVCWPVGGSGTDTRWSCDVQVPPGTRLGAFDVSCEGWSGPGDAWVAAGTCGLEYRLEVAEAPRPPPAPRATPVAAMRHTADTLDAIVVALVLILGILAATGLVMACMAALAPVRRDPWAEERRAGLRYTTRCAHEHPRGHTCRHCRMWVYPDLPRYRDAYPWSMPYTAGFLDGYEGRLCARPAWFTPPSATRYEEAAYEAPPGRGVGETRSRGPAPDAPAAQPMRARADPPATGGTRVRGAARTEARASPTFTEAPAGRTGGTRVRDSAPPPRPATPPAPTPRPATPPPAKQTGGTRVRGSSSSDSGGSGWGWGSSSGGSSSGGWGWGGSSGGSSSRGTGGSKSR